MKSEESARDRPGFWDRLHARMRQRRERRQRKRRVSHSHTQAEARGRLRLASVCVHVRVGHTSMCVCRSARPASRRRTILNRPQICPAATTRGPRMAPHWNLRSTLARQTKTSLHPKGSTRTPQSFRCHQPLLLPLGRAHRPPSRQGPMLSEVCLSLPAGASMARRCLCGSTQRQRHRANGA